jgi:hypothetical protein
MSKHTAPIVRRIVAASLLALVSAAPALAEVRLLPLTASMPAVGKPAPSAAAETLAIAIQGPRATDGILSCTRSGHRMVC